MERAHEYANLSNRARAIASDVLLALEDFDVKPKELYRVKKAAAKHKRGSHSLVSNSLSIKPLTFVQAT